MCSKMMQKINNSLVIPTFVSKVQLFASFMSREKAIRMAGRHWLAQRHFYRQETVIYTGKEL